MHRHSASYNALYRRSIEKHPYPNDTDAKLFYGHPPKMHGGSFSRQEHKRIAAGEILW